VLIPNPTQVQVLLNTKLSSSCLVVCYSTFVTIYVLITFLFYEYGQPKIFVNKQIRANDAGTEKNLLMYLV
jgi:hypothetical protein